VPSNSSKYPQLHDREWLVRQYVELGRDGKDLDEAEGASQHDAGR
jgi:hypothetical protein